MIGYQIAAVVDQRADFVDQARAILFLIHFPFGGGCKKRGVDKDAVESCAGPLEPADLEEEIRGDEILLADRIAVEGIRLLCQVQELPVGIQLDDTACPARARQPRPGCLCMQRRSRRICP